jgi:CheY-like chemotaxis protein
MSELQRLANTVWEQAAPGARRTALLVDDNYLILRNTEAILERLGHVAQTAPCGEAALAQVEAGFDPDVVILDLDMPGLGGVGTLPRLRILRPSVPVILITAWVDRAAEELAAAHSRVTLLPKPFSLKQLQVHLDGGPWH